EIDHAVLVLVVPGEKLFPGRPGRITLAGRPTGKEEHALTNDRRGAGKMRHAFINPSRLAALHVKTFEPNAAGRDDLILTVVAPNDRRAEAPSHFRTLHFPGCFAAAQIDRNQR